ncbi:MAG: hypothetical protein AAFO58_04740, partial [Pseudomonadota bacterium]
METQTDLSLIIDRRETSIEVFARIPAAILRPVFATDPAGLAGPDGRVWFGALRETGTFDFGDAMISEVAFKADGAKAPFEAMSVMVHPADNTLSFDDPIDGNIAMSVCGVADPVIPPTIDELTLYAGFISYPVTADAALTLDLPNTRPVHVAVRQFMEGKETAQDRFT